MACGESMEGAWHLSQATAHLGGRLLISVAGITGSQGNLLLCAGTVQRQSSPRAGPQ